MKLPLYHVIAELVIFARERGGDDFPHLAPILKASDKRLEEIAHRRSKIERRQPKCIRCKLSSTNGLLCRGCLAIAPETIRNAFREATGLRGIRTATRRVKAWALGRQKQQRDAA